MTDLNDLPPLGAVRSFAMAARFENFKRAAAELGVTPTAVSAQVKSLETYLGCRLFDRHAQSVTLTEAGAQFAEDCEGMFARLARAVRDVRPVADTASITIGVGALIGSQWLSRRLFSFWQRFPETRLHLQYSPGGVQFSDRQTDMMLAWGDGAWPGLVAEPLIRFRTAPVLAPSLARGVELSTPADLLVLPILHWKDQADWLEWFAAHGVATDDHLPGVIFDDSSVLLRAALSGQGVALGLLTLIDGELQAGQLIKPFDADFTPSRSYHLVYPQDAMARPQLQAFRNWIMAEANDPHP